MIRLVTAQKHVLSAVDNLHNSRNHVWQPQNPGKIVWQLRNIMCDNFKNSENNLSNLKFGLQQLGQLGNCLTTWPTSGFCDQLELISGCYLATWVSKSRCVSTVLCLRTRAFWEGCGCWREYIGNQEKTQSQSCNARPAAWKGSCSKDIVHVKEKHKETCSHTWSSVVNFDWLRNKGHLRPPDVALTGVCCETSTIHRNIVKMFPVFIDFPMYRRCITTLGQITNQSHHEFELFVMQWY